MAVQWNSNFPLGTVSVKANQVIGQQNTTYTETIMGNDVVGTNAVTTRDHFWNVDANLDGHHRFIQSPAFTVASAPADPVIATSMDGVNYLKLTNGQVQNFFRNAGGIFQTSPNVIIGSGVTLNNSGFSAIANIPANCYGEIFIYVAGLTPGTGAQKGYFISGAAVQGWAIPYSLGSVSPAASFYSVQFGGSGLTLTGKVVTSPAWPTWSYIITYRSL